MPTRSFPLLKPTACKRPWRNGRFRTNSRFIPARATTLPRNPAPTPTRGCTPFSRSTWLEQSPPSRNFLRSGPVSCLRGWRWTVFTFLLWCVLFLLCWPIALLALVVYPVVWVLLLPFRIVGIALEGVFTFLRALFMLPARLLSAPGRL